MRVLQNLENKPHLSTPADNDTNWVPAPKGMKATTRSHVAYKMMLEQNAIGEKVKQAVGEQVKRLSTQEDRGHFRRLSTLRQLRRLPDRSDLKAETIFCKS